MAIKSVTVSDVGSTRQGVAKPGVGKPDGVLKPEGVAKPSGVAKPRGVRAP